MSGAGVKAKAKALTSAVVATIVFVRHANVGAMVIMPSANGRLAANYG